MNSQPPVDSPDAPVDDSRLTPRAWLMRNGVTLLMIGAAFAFLFWNFGPEKVWYGVKVGLGLGFIIFIHELGHFLVAKWCDVHVQTFSIGFGPALPGCSYKYGETTYKLALFPLGGYVKMVGEGDNDPESENDPRSFKNKSVGQRMAIISAGVIMNVIFAFVCFIVVFNHGKERQPAVVAVVDSGGPAWKAGLPTGVEFTKIGSRERRAGRPLYFTDLQSGVALSSGRRPLSFTYMPSADANPITLEITPHRGEDDLRPMIGLAFPESLQLATAEMVNKDRPYPVDHGSVAAAARQASAFRPGDIIVAMTDAKEPEKVTPLPEVRTDGASDPKGLFELSQRWQRLADTKEITVRVKRAGNDVPEDIKVPRAYFQFGDTIIATTDPDDPTKVSALARSPRDPNGEKGDIFDFYKRLDRLAGQLTTIRVRRVDGKTEDLLIPPAYHFTLGARMRMGPITAIRDGSSAAQAGVQKDDLLAEVILTTAKGDKAQGFTLRPAEGATGFRLADPVRLPDELRQWADAHEKEGVKARLTVLRGEGSKREELPAVEWDFRWRFDRVLPIGRSSPQPISELGLGYQIETTVEEVVGEPASSKNGLQKGDVIKEILYREPSEEWGKSKEGEWKKLKEDQWARVFFVLQVAEYKQVAVKVERNGEPVKDPIWLTAQPDETWPMANLGILLQNEKVIQKADGVVQAVEFGLEDTWRGLTEVYLFLRGIIMQTLSVKNLGGPITIARVAYRFAQMDFYEYLFLLGMISINLAAFNFLPIPVLDGGHMVFLIYEKLRGKPASESVQWGALLVGLALLGGLMVGVIILDILKL